MDLAEGFAPAFELPGQPYLRDRCLLPKAVNPGAGASAPSGTPGADQGGESLKATTAKSKAAPPSEVQAQGLTPEAGESAKPLTQKWMV